LVPRASVVVLVWWMPTTKVQIGVVLTNHTEDLFTIYHGDRIAQAKVAPVQRVQFAVVSEFSETTQRGAGAWGSTGIR
jgi:dUTP pyrophosphatase